MSTTTTYSYPNTGFTFGARDALPPGNTEKTVRGVQLDPEFNSIETVLNAKMDFNAVSGEFTGIIDGGIIDGGTY